MSKLKKISVKMDFFVPQLVMVIIYMDVYFFLDKVTDGNFIIQVLGVLFVLSWMFSVYSKIRNEKAYMRISQSIKNKADNGKEISPEEFEELLRCTRKRYEF